MRKAFICLSAVFTLAASSEAQEPPPPIGPFVVDLHATVPNFISEQQLADSRALLQSELPGLGLGLHGGVHVYVFRWRAVTFGLGGELTLARSRRTPSLVETNQRAVTEHFVHVAPQLSFNFGAGDGWSYLSGGIGPATWAIVPDGAAALGSDSERLRTINYGGGARWFVKPRLAFSFDVRFYAVDPGTGVLGLPGGPRTTLLMIGAGVSVK